LEAAIILTMVYYGNAHWVFNHAFHIFALTFTRKWTYTLYIYIYIHIYVYNHIRKSLVHSLVTKSLIAAQVCRNMLKT
jgi:hypothetical protein